MSTTSVSLESLQFLLQHMDANTRFEISQRCPSLREFEKTVPLKIKSLELRGNCVIVNRTTYKIGIIRKYIIGEAPEYVIASNHNGGLPFEVDKYGIKDRLDVHTITPGDVETYQRRGGPFAQGENGQIGMIENQIRHSEERLAQLRQERRTNRNRTSIGDYENAIEVFRAKLSEYQSRRENIQPNYEHFLQITKSRTVDKQEQKIIERYVHNKKFSETMKQLAMVLFGGRIYPIHVTKLNLTSMIAVIRLPVGLKFKIQQLVFSGATMTRVEALASILDTSSFPLRKLDIRIWSDDDATSPMVETAGILKIRIIVRNYLQTIAAITNPVVHITMIGLTEQTIEELVGHWMESQRPVGYEYIFDYHHEPQFADEMEDILKRLNGVPIDDENVIIPMSEVTQLKLSYGPFAEFAPRSKWAVRFLTEAIQH